MSFNIYDFISENQYKEICKSLGSNETGIIYSDDKIDIEIKKAGRRILTFVNTYGDKTVSRALNNVSKLF